MTWTQPMKPLISYYGGKGKIASRIVEIIHRIPHTVYGEPFAGGLAVLFAKGVKRVTNNNHYREVINDRDERLITLYRIARSNPEEFQRWIDFTPYSQAEHRRSIQILRSPDEFSELERAWAYYVNIQMSFANVLGAGWGTGVLGRNLAGTWQSKRERLPACFKRLEFVHVACEDALRFIERWDSPQTLFYCDPPYPGAHQGHYGGYTMEDWQNLCDALDNCSASYILSNYDQPIQPKSAQQRIEILSVMSAAKPTGDRSSKQTREDNQRTEILWVCDRSAGMRSDLKKVLQPSNQLSLFTSQSTSDNHSQSEDSATSIDLPTGKYAKIGA